MKALHIFLILIGLTLFAHADTPKKMLHPKFPVVEGVYQMTAEWALKIDQKHNRRIEDGSLVIWRPGFTIWTTVWSLKDDETPEQRFKSLSRDIAVNATDVVTVKDKQPFRISYRLKEPADDDREPAFYGFVVSSNGHVQIAIYLDDPKDLEKAKDIFKSLTYTKQKSEQDAAGNPLPAE